MSAKADNRKLGVLCAIVRIAESATVPGPFLSVELTSGLMVISNHLRRFLSYFILLSPPSFPIH